MPSREYDPTERRGVAAVQSIFVDKFRWIFREQQVADFGIDAQVEIVRDQKPTGQLIALQIKSGPSNFRTHGENFVFYRSVVPLARNNIPRGAASLTGRSPMAMKQVHRFRSVHQPR